MIKSFTKYILTLVAILMVTSNAWAATATLGAKKQNVTADGITFSLGGSYTINNILVDYSYTASGKEATLSWTVPTGYTISVSQITINAKNDKSWGTTTGKGQYKTSKNGTYTQFCNSNSWSTYTLSSSSYFPLGNGGSITLKAVDKELQWKDIVFTYTKTAHKYNIAFDANGGTGETEDISNISYDAPVNLTPNGFTYNKFIVTYDANGGSCSTTEEIGNYKFAGWAETSNGAVKYTNGQSVKNLTSTDGATVTLYAKWNEPDNATITLPTATKTGAVLEGWYLGDTKIGEAGDTYTPTSSVTLTAKWIEKYTPEIKGSDATILVGEEIPNAFTFKNTSNPTAIITKKSISDIRNGEDVITYNAAENKIIAHNAGVAEIYFVQEPTTTIEGGTSATYTITVNKKNTSFELNFANEYYVDDEINKSTFFTNSNNNEVAISVSDSHGFFTYSDNTLKANGNTMPSGESHTTTITVTQEENYKWTKHTLTKQITLKRHTISAKINQTTAVWNELINNPFSASSTHPVSGQVTKIDNFKVEQQGNEHIALMDTNTRDIQTYYTSGSADFQVTRPEDRKYNALNQTLTLNVDQSEETCHVLEDNAERSWNTINNSGTYTIPSGTPDSLFFQAKRTAIVGISNTSNFYAEYSTDNSTWQQAMTISLSNIGTWYDLKCDIPETAKYVRFVTSMGATGGKQIQNVRVTRAQYLRPTDAEGALGVESENVLELPTIAINQRCSTSFKLSWSACSDIKIVCDNPKFTIGTLDISSANGEQEISVDCNTSEVGTFIGNITIYNQEQMETFPISCEVYTKWLTDSIRGSATYSMKVDTTWDTDFYFPVQRASEYPTTDGHFHYAIEHTFVDADPADRNPNHPDEVISYNNGVITAHNAGTAILTIKHDETAEHFASQQFTCTLTVSKRTPVFTWNDPVYFNQTTISDYFITNNTDTDIKIDSQSDTDVAKLYFNPNDDSDKHTLDLTTYYKETTPASSTTVTVSQAENWYWYAKEDTHTITPQNRNNHISNTPITEANLNDFKVKYVDPWNKPWTNDGIHFGQGSINTGDGGWNWDDKYIIIEFTGVPDSLFFTTATTGTAGMDNPLTNDDNATNNKFFYVSAGTSKDNLEEIWSSTSQTNNYKDKLDPSVRFLKLCYTGNLEGWFKNVRITELNEFRAVDGEEKDVETIDLGTENQVGTHTTANFNFKYANAGYKVKFEIVGANDAATTEARKYITLSHASLQTINGEQYITNIGGEKYGTVESIQVDLYTEKEEYVIPDGTIIQITDETGIHLETIKLTGNILRSDQELYWQGLFLKDPVILPLTVGTITDIAKSSRDLEVTYESSNPEVIKISDDGKSLTPLKEGEVIITAKQEGNYLFNPATPISKPVIVTGKTVQVIICTDDLSDLVLDSAPIELSAEVYIIDLENQGKLQYNEEQTAKLQYEVSDPSVASLEGNVLTPIGLGTATLTITVPGDETYKEDKITVPIRVRPATAGCEDILLVNHRESQEFFAFDLARPEVISKIDTIDLSKGIPGTLDFQYSGKPWKLGIEYYGGEIVAEQSIDGKNWSEIITITPTKNQTESSVDNKLDRNAKYIRFRRPQGGIGYHYVSNIKVYPAQYIETDKTIIDYGQIHIGTQQEFTFNVNYSNIKHELSPKIYLAQDQTATDVVLSQPTQPFGYCGAFGTQTVSGIWTPKTGGLSTERSIVFTDAITGLSATVVLKADVLKKTQRIIWDDAPTTIDDYTDIDSRPAKTKNDLNEDVLDITYEVVEGKDYAFFEDGVFYIKGTGDIVIRAYNDGNFEYEAVEERFTIKITGMPPTFAGGGSDNKWTNIENWVDKIYPETPEKYAVILADAVIDESIQVNQLLVSDEGSVHITYTGGLTVGEGGIQCSKTDGSAIVIDNLHTGAGFLRVDPTYKGTMPRITMRYQTRSTLDNGANKDAEWQYIGAPGKDCQFTVDYITWLYHWSETKGWINKTGTLTLEPFTGYAITQYGKPTYSLVTEPIITDYEVTLTKTLEPGMNGENLFANSFTAPIDAKNFTDDDFEGNLEKTFYVFNSGSWNQWNGQNEKDSTLGDNGSTTPGQYCAIPALSTKFLDSEYDITTIPPMQGVYVIANENEAKIKLNYSKHVWQAGTNETIATDMHEPMRAPKRNGSDWDDNFRRIRIQLNSANSGADRMYIIQTAQTTAGYDNGYDAPNQTVEGLTNIYTAEPFGNMEVSCSNNIDSMYIGFQAGIDSQYTLSFRSLVGDSLYIKDLENDSIIQMIEGEQYHFTAEPNTINNHRFQMLLHPRFVSKGDNTSTSVHGYENTMKIWSQGKIVYILNAPTNSTAMLYSISGQHILSTPIDNRVSPFAIDLSHLAKGVYIIRVNNMAYKFVAK